MKKLFGSLLLIWLATLLFVPTPSNSPPNNNEITQCEHFDVSVEAITFDTCIESDCTDTIAY